MSKEEEIKNGAAEYTKPAPDKTVEQELYKALCDLLTAPAETQKEVDAKIKAIAIVKKYEDNINSK